MLLGISMKRIPIAASNRKQAEIPMVHYRTERQRFSYWNWIKSLATGVISDLRSCCSRITEADMSRYLAHSQMGIFKMP